MLVTILSRLCPKKRIMRFSKVNIYRYSGPDMVAHTFKPSTQDFEASVVYTWSSRSAKAI